MPGEEDGGSESDNDPLFGDLAGSGLEDSGSDEEEAPPPAPAAAPAPAGSGRAAGRAGGQASSQPQPLYSRKSVPQQRPMRASGERSDSVALAGALLPPAPPLPPLPPRAAGLTPLPRAQTRRAR